jgi:hypothetical protein
MAVEVYPQTRTSSSAASVPIVPLRRPISAPATTMCFARYLARKAVKAQLQAAGYKVSYVEARIIAVQANAYLDQHRDALLAEAAMTIDRSPELRKMAEKEARQRAKTVRKMRVLRTVSTSSGLISQPSQMQPTVRHQS